MAAVYGQGEEKGWREEGRVVEERGMKNKQEMVREWQEEEM